MAKLDLAPLARALARFRESIEAHLREPGNDLYRDASIQRFEFTFELVRNTLTKFLKETSVSLKGSEDNPSFATVIRTANQDGLLRSDWETWSKYRDARNQTSHTYNEFTAKSIAEGLPDFLLEVEFLYQRMLQRAAEDV